ncbi:MAG: HAMP domain-containing sensor histidine kinase [Gemmatimonadota bacterium]
MSAPADRALFNDLAWKLALEKYAAVTRLTVTLYDQDALIACGPVHSTPLFALFDQYGFNPGILTDCARQCLAQGEDRPAVIVSPASRIAVVGTSLLLEGEIVGAAVAGYALVDFCQASAVEVLAREAGIPFRSLWEIARTTQPVPHRRLSLHGELLQVLGDAILRENYRARQHEETAAQLSAASAAKDQFLAILSHELRTPLSPILAWSQILKERTLDRPEQQKAAETIERNTRLQIQLVDDLLDLNRVIRDKIALDLALHDLQEVLRLTLDSYSDQAARKTISVEFIRPGEVLAVEGDARRLQQVFGNVLTNAVKFTPSGGHIQVRVERDADHAVVHIVDTGEGIAPTFLPHVFDMFQQQEEGTRRTHSGLGIGLALVKELVELHHGSVDIASGGLGHGTTVTIRLPLTGQLSTPSAADTGEAQVDSGVLNG